MREVKDVIVESKVRNIVIISVIAIIMFGLFVLPVQHVKNDTFTVTTKDAVKVKINSKVVYKTQIVSLSEIKKDNTKHIIESFQLINVSTFAHNLTSLDIYNIKKYDVENIVFKTMGGVTQTLDISTIEFEQAFMDYLKKNDWFGELIMIKTK